MPLPRNALTLATLSLALSVALVAVACEDETAPTGEERPELARVPAPSTAGPLDDEALLARARAAAKQLGQTLKQRLLTAMAEGGPPAAIGVCATEAPDLAARVTRETGVHVGRSSLRLRNPASEGPAWVTAWLTAQGERAAEGVDGFARVEDDEAHVLVPIPVEGVCLNCHGPEDTLLPEVRDALRTRYPEDHATGYEEGALRGALWASLPR